MDMKEKKIRALHFDLFTKKLNQSNGLKSIKQAYKILEDELTEQNFTHRQWSGYTSNQPISLTDTIHLVEEISNKYPWLKECVNHFDVTQVEDVFSLVDYIKGTHKSIEIIKTEPPRFQENNDLYPFDKPTDFISVAIEIGMINVSETVEGIEVYIDYECVGIYESYAEIEKDIKRVEPEIENAVQLVLKTKNKLKEER